MFFFQPSTIFSDTRVDEPHCVCTTLCVSWESVCACISTPVCSSRRDSAAPHAPSESCSVILASVQIAHLHELLLADIIHHILRKHTEERIRQKREGMETERRGQGKSKCLQTKMKRIKNSKEKETQFQRSSPPDPNGYHSKWKESLSVSDSKVLKRERNYGDWRVFIFPAFLCLSVMYKM